MSGPFLHVLGLVPRGWWTNEVHREEMSSTDRLILVTSVCYRCSRGSFVSSLHLLNTLVIGVLISGIYCSAGLWVPTPSAGVG